MCEKKRKRQTDTEIHRDGEIKERESKRGRNRREKENRHLMEDRVEGLLYCYLIV